MSTPTGKSEPSEKNKIASLQSSFTSTASSKAVALVVIAVLVGVLLLVIVDADNVSIENSKSPNAKVVTTTTVSKVENSLSTQVSTSTTTPVSGIKKPAEVSVLVLNGSSASGMATSVSTAIGELGYTMLKPGDDSSTEKGTVVYYKAGFDKDAKQIATNIMPGILSDLGISQPVKSEQFPSNAPTDWDQDNLVGANIIIVVGNS